MQLNNELGSSPPGVRDLAYIALLDESGPSDQTDLHPTVFLDPQRRWSIIRETRPDWSRGQGGRPRAQGGRPVSWPVTAPVRSRGFWNLLDVR